VFGQAYSGGGSRAITGRELLTSFSRVGAQRFAPGTCAKKLLVVFNEPTGAWPDRPFGVSGGLSRFGAAILFFLDSCCLELAGSPTRFSLFVSQGHYRIDPHSPAGWWVRRKQSNHEK
jgi:hypothetical protein